MKNLPATFCDMPGARLLVVGQFELDPETGDLRRQNSGIQVRLPPQASRLLLLLINSAGHLVTRDEIQRYIWGDANIFVDSTQGINFYISKLRKALSDNPDTPRYIETISRRGYRFIAPVRTAVCTPADQPQEKAKLDSRSRYNSIAVLPFNNFSGSAVQEYFADGMTEAIITTLAQLSSLQVTSRTSAMQCKNTKQSLPEIARQLKVDLILQGAVVRSHGRVRVTVQLIDAETDRHLWAKNYERHMRDVLVMQREVAEAIAKSIEVKLMPQDCLPPANVGMVSPQAYDAYLRGRYYWNKRSNWALVKAIKYFEKAIMSDPNDALAYAGIADCYNALGFWELGELSPMEAFQKSKQMAMKALEIDNTLAECHASLAAITLYYDWNWVDAEREFKLAIALNSNYATAHHWYSFLLSAQKQVTAALGEIRRAQELDPLSPVVNAGLAWCFYYAGQYDEVIEQSLRTLELDGQFAPAHLTLGLGYQGRGICGKAIAALRRGLVLSGGSPVCIAALANAYGIYGRKSGARKRLSALLRLSKRRYVSAYDCALVAAGLGEKDEALKWLDKALLERSLQLIYLAVEPRFEILRSDSRFDDVLRCVGVGTRPPGQSFAVSGIV